LTQEEKYSVHTIIEAFTCIGLIMLAFNAEYEHIALQLGQILYPIVTLLKMMPSRELLDSNYYVAYLLNLYFNDIIPSMLYVLSAIIFTK
jgi:hypothetical protein